MNRTTLLSFICLAFALVITIVANAQIIFVNKELRESREAIGEQIILADTAKKHLVKMTEAYKQELDGERDRRIELTKLMRSELAEFVQRYSDCKRSNGTPVASSPAVH